MTGAFIAAYTVWDKQAVSALLVNPVLYSWGTTLGRVLLLTPRVVTRPTEIASTWRLHRAEAIGVGVLSPLAYILVLVALVSTPVSYVAPAREIGILVVVLMGARWLTEPDVTRRWVAAVIMVVGIALLAVQ